MPPVNVVLQPGSSQLVTGCHSITVRNNSSAVDTDFRYFLSGVMDPDGGELRTLDPDGRLDLFPAGHARVIANVGPAPITVLAS